MIQVNTDTYIEVDEADEYVGKYYLDTDAKSTAWNGLNESQKEVVLRNAAMAIDSIVFPGRKKDLEQEMEFPRCYKNGYYFPLSWYETYTLEGGSWHCQIDVPLKIRNAQIEEALEIASASVDSENYQVFNGNLKSFSITGLSETYNLNTSGAVASVKNALRSSRAQRWVGKYVGGGFNVN